VNASSPAAPGETVLIFLTGMGSVTPPVADGTAATGLSDTNARPLVLVAGIQATVVFSGLAPGFPGLYQINATLPSLPGGNLPLAIQVGRAIHDQVYIPVR
jgi:uncharacterized protein (TIGR03437 family)